MSPSTTPATVTSPLLDSPVLDIRGLSHRYGSVLALDDVSLGIADNEFFALLGPSGCGKTTLLRAIAGFEVPSGGQILLDGKDLTTMPANLRPINMMFQSYALFPHLSVAKNVAYGLEADGVKTTEIRRRVGETLEMVGLASLAERRPAKLSGGQRQRVALARAIIKRPRLLLLDEPLSALDRKVRSEMQLELKRMQVEAGMTFVVVTHDQEEAMSMADRIALLHGGKIEQIGTPLDLYSNPATRFVASFIGSANLFDGVTHASGVDVAGAIVFAVSHQLGAGVAATMVVRPEDVRIVTPEEGQLQGVVVDAFFLGGSSTVSISVAGLQRTISCTVHAAGVPVRGSKIGVTFDLSRATVVANPAQ